MRSSSRSPVPPRTPHVCSCPRGRTRDCGSDRVSVDAWGFDVERQATARRLRSLRIRLSAIRFAIAAALTLALVYGWAGALRDWVLSLPVPSWAATITFLAALFALVTAVDLPFRYVAGCRWERAFGLSAQPFVGWLKDLAKSVGLGLGVTVAAGYLLLWLLALWPTWWWLAAWLISLAVSVVLAFIAPIVLVPLFYRFRPLADPNLRARFESLAAQATWPGFRSWRRCSASFLSRSGRSSCGGPAPERHGPIDSPSSSHAIRRTSQRRWRSSTTRTSVSRTRSHGRSGCFTAIHRAANASSLLGPIAHRPRKNRGIFITTQPMVAALGAEVA